MPHPTIIGRGRYARLHLDRSLERHSKPHKQALLLHCSSLSKWRLWPSDAETTTDKAWKNCASNFQMLHLLVHETLYSNKWMECNSYPGAAKRVDREQRWHLPASGLFSWKQIPRCKPGAFHHHWLHYQYPDQWAMISSNWTMSSHHWASPS